GSGMSPEQMRDLFKPFYRVDSSITRKQGGTGLGLSISKLLCERMGGSITAASEPARGTTFVVRLPANITETDARARAPALPNGAKQQSDLVPLQTDAVLVIDDDPLTREMVQSYLQREGFRVHLAANAEDGLRLARVTRPGVITLDVFMPDSDGWTVLTALKN